MSGVADTGRLLPWSLFAALIAAAGLPIYIHAPKFYVDDYGVGLASLGAALFVLRLVDVVQDPALGWLAEATRARRGAMVAGAAAVMALSMLGLFAVAPPVAPLVWFAAMLLLMFSAFSFLSIAFYAEGVQAARRFGPNGHLRLATWREAGGLIGVSVAAVAPVTLGAITVRPFAGFAAGFAVLTLVAVWAMRRNWAGAGVAQSLSLRAALADGVTRRLLLLSFVNGAPVAVTSTLFLFFVESRLQAPGYEGPLLLLFFLAAAASTPVWGALAARHGARRVLMAGMGLAILAFVFAARLGAGDIAAFAVISVASGAALGADMTLLPAIFARHLARVAPDQGAANAFGLWSFASKLSLAFAAATLLPLLDAQGFRSGPDNTAAALALLSALYALVPCALKVVAMALLATTRIPEV